MTPLPITVGSLFSGIGGFDLGVERAGCRVAWQVEIDPWCRNILAKHWPDLPRYEDVLEVGAHNLDPVDWIVGGFPCQDISTSGRQDGLEGARSGLWWEFHRIIGELRPQIVIVENVANLLHLGIESVLGSLADLGYDAEWDIISAADIGARHIRKRIWIVAMGDTDCSVLERGDACGDTEISRSDRKRSKTSGDGLATAVKMVDPARSGSLNPNWVEWLMGYPTGFTDLKGSAMPSCPKSLK